MDDSTTGVKREASSLDGSRSHRLWRGFGYTAHFGPRAIVVDAESVSGSGAGTVDTVHIQKMKVDVDIESTSA